MVNKSKMTIAAVGMATVVLLTAQMGMVGAAGAAPPGKTAISAKRQPYADIANTDPFGCGTSAQATQYYPVWLPKLARAGARWERIGVGWGGVEPAKGKWDWSQLDAMIRTAAANHVFISSLLIGNPRWTGGRGLPVHDLAAWSDYVSHIVAHTAGKIDYWEIWNEPSRRSARAYARVVVAAYNAAKKANPRVQIGLTVHSVDIVTLQDVIRDGAANHFDYIAVHPYEVFGALQWGQESVFMHIIGRIRKMLAVYDPARVNVPIWITEVGMGPSSARPGDLIKAYAMGIAEGFAHIEWFEAMGEAYNMGLLNNAGRPTRSYAALKNMTRVMGTDPKYIGWVLLDGGGYGFIFHGAAGTVMAAWSKPGATGRVRFGSTVKIMDPVSGVLIKSALVHLTGAPVLIMGAPAGVVIRAAENRTRPFPWAGNYTAARQISWIAGKPDTADGLHWNRKITRAVSNVFHGRRAKFVGASPGVSFTVDPNFLSFTPTPITIIAEVCQKAGGHAGFNLRYEATTGWKSIGWNAVPADGKWHTLRWKINDDEFVSDWGYNFSFWSDSTANSRYYIRKVSVIKDGMPGSGDRSN